jgi:hypothetical protein
MDMTMTHSSNLETALPDQLECPAMWTVLVCRLEMAERRRRISDDWEEFAFGARARANRSKT